MTGSGMESRVQLSGAWTRLLIEAFDKLGMDTEALCAETGISRATMIDPAARIPRDAAGRLWRAAAKASGDRLLGIHAARAARREPDHLFEFLFLKGATLADGVEIAHKYQALVSHGKVASLETNDGGRQVRLHRVEGALPVTPHETEFLAATIVGYCRMATANRFALDKVSFAHPFRGAQEEYERFFRCPVFFAEAHSELFIPNESWNLQLAVADPDEQKELATVAADLHQRVELPTFLSSVSREIGSLLSEGQGTVNEVAASLHLSSRTLQRRLREQGTTFRDILEARRRVIITEGVESRRAPSEIARRAGFTNVRGLFRAMRRWGARSQ
ncbi:MAG: AraC family transcriptional regulator ligand-binding domain-containing protein [Myxococcota bacterium]